MGKGKKEKKRKKRLSLGLLQNANFSLQSRNCTKIIEPFNPFPPPKGEKKEEKEKKMHIFCVPKS
jgi:hypothetical protein